MAQRRAVLVPKKKARPETDTPVSPPDDAPRTKQKGTAGGSYFAAPSTELEFFSSGSALLDCVLGGGYPLGRVVNIVGDKSTGKTLLAIEACANFARRFAKGRIDYDEAESAFDKPYAAALGMPISRVRFPPTAHETVEDVFEHLNKWVEKDSGEPGLYILDSLDALSDRAELARNVDEGSYGTGKAKQMSRLFRELVRRITERRVCVIIISQVRDNIGVTFGRKTTRSGGRALDFYASQVLYLAQIKTLKKTVSGVQRAIGLEIKAKCDKNKVGLPLRECVFPIRFGYGIDDIAASVHWLEEVGKLDAAGLNKAKLPGFLKGLENATPEEVAKQRAELDAVVREQWYVIEKDFLPTRRKY
jgi:recombination protein RecA